MFKKIIALIAIFSVLLVVAACSAEVTETTTSVTTTEMTTQTTVETTTVETTTESNEPTLNIVEAAEAAGSFSTLITALETAGLRSTLEGEGAYTVFAPTDVAFSALLTALDIDATTLLGVENLSDILLYHVLDGAYYSSDVVANSPFDVTTLEGSDVSFTVMDGKAYINGVEIVTTDILTTNGVIHVISEVILPLGNIIEAAEAAGSFSTLITALETAGLRSTLEGEGAYTVFAPTDAAFSALLIALDITEQDLLALSNLDQILLLHVLNGAYYSTDVLAAAPISIASLQGTNLDFTIADDVIYVNGTSVIVEDILTSNGIIHVINQVLLLE